MSIKSNGDSTQTPANVGDVDGPASAVADDIATFNGVTGKIIKDSGVAISNVPLLNAANTFTANQEIVKTIPALKLRDSADSSAAHVFSLGNNDAYLTANLTFDGTNFNLDDTAQKGYALGLDGGVYIFYDVTAGANPRTSTEILVISNPGTIDLKGGQLIFPATQNPSSGANTLDDYEEGTWTVTDASGAALGLVGASASYIKIGKYVFVRFVFTYPATASGAGAQITGLPFTAAAGVPGGSGKDAYPMVAGANVFAYVRESTTNIQFYKANGAQYTNAELTGTTAYFTASYFASA